MNPVMMNCHAEFSRLATSLWSGSIHKNRIRTICRHDVTVTNRWRHETTTVYISKSYRELDFIGRSLIQTFTLPTSSVIFYGTGLNNSKMIGFPIGQPASENKIARSRFGLPPTFVPSLFVNKNEVWSSGNRFCSWNSVCTIYANVYTWLFYKVDWKWIVYNMVITIRWPWISTYVQYSETWISTFIPSSVLILASDWLTTVKYRGVSHVWRHQREI